jgi:hypothetical protein
VKATKFFKKNCAKLVILEKCFAWIIFSKNNKYLSERYLNIKIVGIGLEPFSSQTANFRPAWSHFPYARVTHSRPPC